jgi:hypothetical protein
VTVTLAPLLPEEPPLFTETRRARGPQTFLPLPAAAAVPAAPMIGAYRVVVTAEDSGGPADTLVRVLLVQRLAADTQLHPPEIDRDVLLAESLTTARRRPAFLLLTAMGVGAIVASKGWSGEQASPTTVVIPGALALGGIVWFFKGKVETQAVPANVAHNQRLRNERATAVRQVAAANERARTAMPFRVRIVDQR